MIIIISNSSFCTSGYSAVFHMGSPLYPYSSPNLSKIDFPVLGKMLFSLPLPPSPPPPPPAASVKTAKYKHKKLA